MNESLTIINPREKRIMREGKTGSMPENAVMLERVQKLITWEDWKAAIGEMEKLLDIDPNPVIRAHPKPNQKDTAIREHMRTADLYAKKGLMAQSLAQYKAALRLGGKKSERTIISERVQSCIEAEDWKAAIGEMEKLSKIDPDPIVRVRIGDAYQKLNREWSAISEYMRAADLYADTGFPLKARALYKLVLRLQTTTLSKKWSAPLKKRTGDQV